MTKRATPHICKEVQDALLRLQPSKYLCFSGRVENPNPLPANKVGTLEGDITIEYEGMTPGNQERIYNITVPNADTKKEKEQRMFVVVRQDSCISTHLSWDPLTESRVEIFESGKTEPIVIYPHRINYI